MRILFFTDPHCSDTPPRMRKDSYREDILDKMRQLVEPASACDFVVCGGDIFHQKNPSKVSYKLVYDIMDIFQEFPDTFIIPGNHDVFNRTDDVVSGKSPLAIFDYLTNVHFTFSVVEELGENISLFAVGYGDMLENHLVVEMCKASYKSNLSENFKIGVFHSSVSYESYPFSYIPADDVDSYFDLLLVGHLHDYQILENKIVAPGSLSRGVLKIDDSLTREVGYALVEIKKGKAVSEFVPLEIKPYEEVFKLDVKEREKRDKAAVGELISFIERMEVPSAMDSDTLLEYIEGLELEEAVKKKAIEIVRGL